MDRHRSLSDRLYAALLRAYPPGFRREAGLDMAEMFRDLQREAWKRSGAGGLLGLWARTLADVVRNAPPERLAVLGSGGERPRRDPSRRKGDGMVQTILRELGRALRALRQRPGFAALTVATLALGLGANTAIFSVVKTVLLSPLPYPQPERLVFVRGRAAAGDDSGRGSLGLAWPDFVELRDGNRSFAGLALVRGQSVNLTGGDRPERVTGIFATASLFSSVLATPAHHGRLFAAEETEIASVRPVAVVSHGLWQRRFGGDPALVGRSLTLNGEPFTVVGVLPPDFELNLVGGTWTADVFLPMPYYPNRDGLTREDRSLYALGRLLPGVGLAQAEADLGVIAGRLEKEFPATNAGLGVGVAPLRDMVVDDVRPSLLVLQGAVALVLLIACANVANLLLARAADRRKEIALRSALGAGGGRIVGELLAESVVLAGLGGLLGVLLGTLGSEGPRRPRSRRPPPARRGGAPGRIRARLQPRALPAHGCRDRPRPRPAGPAHRPGRGAEGGRALGGRRPPTPARGAGRLRSRALARAPHRGGPPRAEPASAQRGGAGLPSRPRADAVLPTSPHEVPGGRAGGRVLPRVDRPHPRRFRGGIRRARAGRPPHRQLRGGRLFRGGPPRARSRPGAADPDQHRHPRLFPDDGDPAARRARLHGSRRRGRAEGGGGERDAQRTWPGPRRARSVDASAPRAATSGTP